MFTIRIVVISTGEPPPMKFTVILLTLLKSVSEVERNLLAGFSGLHYETPVSIIIITI